MEYLIHKASRTPKLNGEWDGPVWSRANTLDLTNWYRTERSEHRPKVQARVLYDDKTVYVAFKVKDRYVRSTREDWQGCVCRDSCVEFFVRPKPKKGYFNFEMNAGGTLLLYYIEDETRTPTGFKTFKEVSYDLGKTIQVYHSLPAVVYPEIKKPTTWFIEYAVPVALFEHYVGKLGNLAGQEWRANFYKCGDATSHPHWASWAPLGDVLNFHLPRFFQPIRFAE
jgi:hypothetical protein